MINQELLEWFQEETKKNIIDITEENCPQALAVSFHDDEGIVWVEGLIHTARDPFYQGPDYLLQYSIQRDTDLPAECPYSVSITVIDPQS